SFTALAILQLQDEGRLSVTDPVQQWLPRFQLPGTLGREYSSTITLHHLLTHSSGIPPEPSLGYARYRSIREDPDWTRLGPRPIPVPDDFTESDLVETYDELLALMARQDFTLLGPPGQYFSYSNEGYALLARIVELASGQDFRSYVRTHLIDRLGLSRTGFYARPEPLPAGTATIYSHTRGENGSPEVIASPAWYDCGRIYGNGGMTSTIQDLIRYLDVFRQGGTVDGARIVSSQALNAMMAPLMPIPTGAWYGYGLTVRPEFHGDALIGHGGGNKGIAAWIGYVPNAGLTVAVLTNLDGAPASRLGLGAINLCLGLPATTPEQTYAEHSLPLERLARFAGLYRGQPGDLTRFTLRDGVLVYEADDRRQPCRPYADDAVLIQGAEMPARFLFDPAGEVWAVSLGLRIKRKVAE
ncbi:MAG TPA: serine hydrolase, partial [Thermomicrobiaceae bacterium]|nr:serine hydrolase [Thermomicrobiaceae bacterium]